MSEEKDIVISGDKAPAHPISGKRLEMREVYLIDGVDSTKEEFYKSGGQQAVPGPVMQMVGMPDGSVCVMTASGEVWRPVKYGRDAKARWEIMIDHSPVASERDQNGPTEEEMADIKAQQEAEASEAK